MKEGISIKENKSLNEFLNIKKIEDKYLYTYSKIIDDNNVKFEYSDNQKTLSIYDNGIKYLYEYDNNRLYVYLYRNSDLQKLMIYDFTYDEFIINNSENSNDYLIKFNEKYKKVL